MKSSNPRRSYYCDFNISPYNLEYFTFALICGIVFTKSEVGQLIRSWHVAFLMLMSCHAVTLTFDPWALKVCGTSGVTVTSLWSAVNLSKIGQSAPELLII